MAHHDQYKYHPLNQGDEDRKGVQVPNDCGSPIDRSYLTASSWLLPHGTADGHESYENISTPNGDEYPAQEYHSAHSGSDSNEMPSLPCADVMRTGLYLPPTSNVTPSDSFQSLSMNEHANPIYRRSQYFSEAPPIAPIEGLSSVSSESTTTSTYNPESRPVPARSAFIMFSEATREEIMRRAGPNGKEGAVNAVAREWRHLPKDAKKYWEAMARNDKTRYVKEKKLYSDNAKGVSLVKKVRAKKHPGAPKRPMSAFLMYAQQQRKRLQADNPDMSNADVSRLLGETWRNLSDTEKLPHLQREQAERKVYQAKMTKWKNDQKLINSLKTANERRQDSEEARARDDRHYSETDANLKYAPQPFDELRRDHEPFTPSHHMYGHEGHQMWHEIDHNGTRSRFDHYNDSAPAYYTHLPSQQAYGQNNQTPKLFSYPRPEEEQH